MNPDYYFVEAGKKAMRGELTSAIDMLKRGLSLQPNHFFCRFNHGVVLFKLGLIVEASNDFLSLTLSHPKEAWPHYNLAVCLAQMGLPVASKDSNSPTNKKLQQNCPFMSLTAN
jgi:tetratricopeptide (TPR) repeat protein